MRPGLLALALVVALAAAAEPAEANFDVFDSELITQPDAFGQEVPYAGGATVTFTKDVGSTAAFGVDPGESNTTQPNFNGCSKNPPVFAGRTAWVRFDPAVDGEIYIEAETPTYDSIVFVREAAQRPWKSTSFASLVGNYQNCEDVVDGPGSEKTFAPDARGDRVYYVQVGGKCPGGPDTCTDPAVPGGQTRLSLTFKPDDSDRDGVPDTAPDNCPGTTLGTRVTTDGCPDEDGDNVQDDADGCKGQSGDPKAPKPYTGCPPGPNPPVPPGFADVIIKSTAGNGDTTTDETVNLLLNWPKGAQQAFANNRTGDAEKEIPLKRSVEWDLSPRQNGRGGSRDVEVRFAGPNIPDSKDDDSIDFDPAPPKVKDAFSVRTGAKRWTVVVGATDDFTGLREFAALNSLKQSVKAQDVCGEGATCLSAARRPLTGLRSLPRSVRVTDDAGNEQLATVSSTPCDAPKVKVLRLEVFTKRCFTPKTKRSPGDKCGSIRGRYDWDHTWPGIKCAPVDGHKPLRVQYR